MHAQLAVPLGPRKRKPARVLEELPIRKSPDGPMSRYGSPLSLRMGVMLLLFSSFAYGLLWSPSKTSSRTPPAASAIQWVKWGENLSFSIRNYTDHDHASPGSYEWRLNGQILPNRTTGAIVISHAQYEDAGVYQCLEQRFTGFYVVASFELAIAGK